MNFGISAYSWWETKVADSLSLFVSENLKIFFSKYYGSDLNDIFIVLMCRQPEHNFKERIRYIKKEKALYMDIILDFNLLIKSLQEERNQNVFAKLIKEVPDIIAKYKYRTINKFWNVLCRIKSAITVRYYSS
jgi:hypothetical protein